VNGKCLQLALVVFIEQQAPTRVVELGLLLEY